MATIKELLEDIKLLLQQNKQIMTAEEAADFIGISKNYLYRLTSQGKIKYYRPFGKILIFDRAELITSVKQNEVKLQSEIIKKATDYLLTTNSKRQWKK